MFFSFIKKQNKLFILLMVFVFSILYFFINIEPVKAQECCVRYIYRKDPITNTIDLKDGASAGGGGVFSAIDIDINAILMRDACRKDTISNPCHTSENQCTWFNNDGTITDKCSIYGDPVVTKKDKVYYYHEQRIGCAEQDICEEFVVKNNIDCSSLSASQCPQNKVECAWIPSLGGCVDRYSQALCSQLILESDCTKEKTAVCVWDGGKCITQTQYWVRQAYDFEPGSGLVGSNLPECAALGECSDLNELISVFVLVVQSVFKYVGAIAFVFFVYGGGVMVLSFGNAEKFKHGRSVLVAAVIGLIIVFAGYFIVGFILETLGVSSSFNLFR